MNSCCKEYMSDFQPLRAYGARGKCIVMYQSDSKLGHIHKNCAIASQLLCTQLHNLPIVESTSIRDCSYGKLLHYTLPQTAAIINHFNNKDFPKQFCYSLKEYHQKTQFS